MNEVVRAEIEKTKLIRGEHMSVRLTGSTKHVGGLETRSWGGEWTRPSGSAGRDVYHSGPPMYRAVRRAPVSLIKFGAYRRGEGFTTLSG